MMKKETEDEKFLIREYTKLELAILYNPNMKIESAQKKLTRWVKGCGSLMKELEADGLVIYINKNGRRHIFLPYYEEHCGRKVRPVEQADGTIHSQNQTDKDFDLFWEFYHEMIPVTPQDRAKARKIYGRLSLNDRESAVRNVEVYYASLASEKHAKWAVNYLKDKSFIMDKQA